MDLLLPLSGGSLRLGITGVPGVGKSTLIEALGKVILADTDAQIAVLAVDPTSPLTHGSILGDKSRMPWLSNHPRAYVRPSPSQGSLGGVAARTREVIQLCEAFGCTAVIVETVGVGQSEVAVAGLVDCFLLLLLAGAGDEVQGIKKGVIEMADLAAVTKCDGANLVPAKIARQMALNAFHLMGRETEVYLTSSVTGDGLPDLWGSVQAFVRHAGASGEKAARRGRQGVQWMTEMVERAVLDRFYSDPEVAALLGPLKDQVRRGLATPRGAAERVLSGFDEG